MHLALIPTLFFFFGVVSVIYGLALRYYLKTSDAATVAHWSLGSFLLGVATLLTTFRADIPLLVSYVMANALAYVSYIQHNRALKSLVAEVQVKPIHRLLDVLQFAAFSALLYAIDQGMTEGRDVAKVAFVSLPMVVMHALGARHCFALGREHRLNIARNFGMVYVFIAFLWLARVLAAVFNQGAHAFDPKLINTLIFVGLHATGVVRYVVFPLVVLRKAEDKNQEHLRTSLAKANKTITSGALSASIAHELNQPLASIRLNVQILRKVMLDPQAMAAHADAQSIIEDILAENERAAKIIQSLRSIFMQTSAVKTRQNAALLIQRSADLVAQQLERSGIKLELSLAEDVWVSVAEDEFRQVLLNLLLNSIQALQDTTAPLNRIILIRSSQQAGQVQIVVADSGPGVAKDRESLLFEILSSTKDSGMGIGLWLCRYIVERMGGRIDYARSALGGAQFTITVPHSSAALAASPCVPAV